MPQIYEQGKEFTATSGQDNCVVLPAPPRGILRKLVVKQVNGVADGFTFNLFNRSDACPSVAEVSDPFDPDALLDPDLHKIQDEIAISAPTLISSQFGFQRGYANEDEQDVRRTRASRIYLSINPGGAGDKLFQVGYAIEPIAAV